MGVFNWPIRLSSVDGEHSIEVDATVDTGSTYTTVPGSWLRDLGIAATGRRRFLLSDGRRVYGDIGQAWITINGESVITLVAFGEEDGPTLLGAYTLEGLALAPDPVEGRLVSVDMIMY